MAKQQVSLLHISLGLLTLESRILSILLFIFVNSPAQMLHAQVRCFTVLSYGAREVIKTNRSIPVLLVKK